MIRGDHDDFSGRARSADLADNGVVRAPPVLTNRQAAERRGSLLRTVEEENGAGPGPAQALRDLADQSRAVRFRRARRHPRSADQIIAVEEVGHGRRDERLVTRDKKADRFVWLVTFHSSLVTVLLLGCCS